MVDRGGNQRHRRLHDGELRKHFQEIPGFLSAGHPTARRVMNYPVALPYLGKQTGERKQGIGAGEEGGAKARGVDAVLGEPTPPRQSHPHRIRTNINGTQHCLHYPIGRGGASRVRQGKGW